MGAKIKDINRANYSTLTWWLRGHSDPSFCSLDLFVLASSPLLHVREWPSILKSDMVTATICKFSRDMKRTDMSIKVLVL